MSKFNELLDMEQDDADAILDAEMDATSTVYGLRPGHMLTQTDFDAIQLYDKNWRDDAEHKQNVFHQGYQSGLRRGSGADTAKLIDERDAARSAKVVANAVRSSGEYHAFIRGARACREMIARFVEQGGDETTATSIRANWHPSWGKNPVKLEGDISSAPEITTKDVE